MAKNLARILDTDMPRLPLRKAAEQLRKKGRGKDTMLAHITPKEAALLKARGGSGTINPDTGLPEFDDSFFSSFDFNLPTEISTPIESGNFYTSNVQQPDFVQQPAFGSNVDQASVDLTKQSYGQGPFGDITQNLGTGTSAPYYDPQLAQALQAYAEPSPPASGRNIAAIDAVAPTARANDALAFETDTSGKLTNQVAPEDIGSRGDMTVKQQDTAGKTPGGIQTPFGTLGTKDLIAALGLGGLGLSYMNAQNQGKSAAQQLQNAYNTAAQQQTQLAQPYMQQGGQQLSQALTGALSPAQQQQLAAAQASAAQGTATSGGVGAAQAGRSIEDLRQRLLANQQTMALQLLGAGTPLISNAINQQLQGTVSGLSAQQTASAQAGQAATGMLTMLAAMYGRSA